MRVTYNLDTTRPNASGAIWLRAWHFWAPDEFRNVVLHELGHHLGCRDDGDPGEVMDRYAADQGSELTEADLACATALEPI